MEKEMISYATLKKVLTPKELKNILGGTGEYVYCTVWCDHEEGPRDAKCASSDPCECATYGPPSNCAFYGPNPCGC